jgi:UDP-N-acetylmuramoylalanine--D-glutamate ligase
MILILEEQMTFKNKKILVVGLARSGTGAANLLSTLGAIVTVTDRKSRSELEGYINRLQTDIRVITDGNPQRIFEEVDMIVISPGVPLNIQPLIQAKAKGIPIIGELELAYQIIDSRVNFIAVTGTNGKSTVTTLIDLMLKESGCKTLIGGNIGNALTEELLKVVNNQQLSVSEILNQLNIDYIVVEVSSFQLETIEEFRPRIGAILNITPDHLDRYDNMKDYMNVKARIFENQRAGDYLILNADDPLTMELYNSKFKIRGSDLPQVLFFSRMKDVKGIYCDKGNIYCNLPQSGLTAYPLMSASDIKIKGIHNLENAMAASLIAMISGSTPDDVRKVLKDFPGLEHRLEFVKEIDGITFINDSKGTNVGAVAKSLEGFENVILIMGGISKGDDFSSLKDLIKQKVKFLILLGEAKEKIEKALSGTTEILKVNNLDEAVKTSVAIATKGDVVLLSPGCASFDMFRDFEDRGKKFKEIVKTIQDSK